jgi:hypothetical protein
MVAKALTTSRLLGAPLQFLHDLHGMFQFTENSVGMVPKQLAGLVRTTVRLSRSNSRVPTPPPSRAPIWTDNDDWKT